MSERNDIVKLAVNAYHKNVEKYSVAEANELLRQALIEANGGSTKLNYKNIRDGKCQGLFSLVEEILAATVLDGLHGDEFFMAMVEERNLPEGDQNVFVVEDSDVFVVSEIADGTQGLRRQRLGGASEIAIPTSLKGVKIYEELNRVLSGRVDFNYLIDKVAESFRRKVLEDVATAWNGVTSDQLGGVTYFPTAGAYDEDALLDLIAHVEAASGGKTATVVGTKKALRNLVPAYQGQQSLNDLYTTGFYGSFYGTPCVYVPQRHKAGTTDFAMDDDVLTIVAGDERPIKFVYEGEPLVIMGDPLTNGDLTQEYMYADKYGVGIVLASNHGIGRYEMA